MESPVAGGLHSAGSSGDSDGVSTLAPVVVTTASLVGDVLPFLKRTCLLEGRRPGTSLDEGFWVCSSAIRVNGRDIWMGVYVGGLSLTGTLCAGTGGGR